MKIIIELEELNKTYYAELFDYFKDFIKSECVKGEYSFDDGTKIKFEVTE